MKMKTGRKEMLPMKTIITMCILSTAVLGNPCESQNYALSFDGTGDFVVIPDNFELSGGANKSITVEAWVWIEGSGIQSFVTKFADSCSKTWGMSYHLPGGQLSFETERNCSNYISMAGTISSKTWTHAAFTFDGTTNTVNLFLNGKFVGTAPADPLFLTQSGILFGSRYVWDTSTFALKGMLDEIRIWSAARTQEEIQNSMNNSLAGDEENLIGYWPLNEGSGQHVFDWSNYQNHGMLGVNDSLSGDSFDPQWVELGPLFNTSLDCNENNILDKCEKDTDKDGIIDDCDIDIDNDGVENELDVCNFSAIGVAVDFEGRSLGDIDLDCDTDLEDFGLFQRGFFLTGE